VKNKSLNIEELLKTKPELALIIQILSPENRNPSGSIPLAPFSKGGLNQGEFIRLVKHHRLDSILFQKIESLNIDLPTKLKQKLEQINKRNKMRMLKLTSELIRIHQIFTENNIDYISLKGPALSQQIYGDYTIRSSRDLDILVNPKKILEAKILLESIGYKTQDKYTKLSKFNDKEVKFFNSEKNTLVELHHRLFNNKYLFPFSSEILNNIRFIKLNTVEIPSLSDTDNFLYIATHAAAHNWSRLVWAIDIINFKKIFNKIEASEKAKDIGLTNIYLQAKENTLNDFVCISDEKHYRLFKRMQHLLSLNSKYKYKKYELLQRSMIPYRYIAKMLK